MLSEKIENFFQWLKKFIPFLGISFLFFSLVILITFLFNYYDVNSFVWLQKINPFYLLIRWDSVHYLNIVTQGYEGQLIFFPLYPLAVAGFSIFFPPITSGFLVSFLSLSASLYYLYKLIKIDNEKNIANRSILLLLVFPTAMFFSLIYTESLFLAIIAAFFYYIKKGKWLTAAIIGFFATLTRNIGIFLWPVYLAQLFLFFYPTNFHNKLNKVIKLIKKKEFWYSLIIPMGLLIFCFYGYFTIGDFFSFINSQNNWAQWRTFVLPGKTFYNFYKIIFIDSINQTGLYNFFRIVIIEGLSFLLIFITTIYWIIKKHWSYATFCLLNVLLLSCLYPMLSANRYTVVIFPIFIFLASITKKNDWLFYTILLIFFSFFVFNVYLFSTGSWIG